MPVLLGDSTMPLESAGIFKINEMVEKWVLCVHAASFFVLS